MDEKDLTFSAPYFCTGRGESEHRRQSALEAHDAPMIRRPATDRDDDGAIRDRARTENMMDAANPTLDANRLTSMASASLRPRVPIGGCEKMTVGTSE